MNINKEAIIIKKSVDAVNIMVGTRRQYCPECLVFIKGINFTTGNPKCSCGWTDEAYNLLTKEEVIALRRIKLIDEAKK